MIADSDAPTAEAAETPLVETAPAPPHHESWNIAQRIGFRFVFLYLGLYNMVVLANTSSSLIPGLSYLVGAYTNMWHVIVPWVGKNMLHLEKEITYFPSGSGDKTSDWVLVLCYFSIAMIGTVLWSALDYRRKQYDRAQEWLRVWVRYAIAFTMLNYGFVKVIKLQFQDTPLTRLVEPFGEFSPMGVLWTFMGSSTPYTFFGGLGEVTGGLLLFFRRTTTLGALVTGGVMLNVAVMNYCYDVPVKLLATHLCLGCLFLLAPDLHRLTNLLVLNRPANARVFLAHFTNRWMKYGSWAFKTALIGFALFNNGYRAIEGGKRANQNAPRPPTYGIWEVEEFTRDGQVVPPLTTETTRWRKFVSANTVSLVVRTMDDAPTYYRAEYDEKKSTISLVPSSTAAVNAARGQVRNGNPQQLAGKKDILNFDRPDFEHLNLSGTLAGVPISAKMRRIDENKFTLQSRGFHWVSELPFNK